MSHLVFEAKLLACSCGIASADNRYRIGFSKSLGNLLRAVLKVRHFEYAHRAVPYNRLCILHRFGKQLHGFRSDIHSHPVFRHVFFCIYCKFCIIFKFLRTYRINRQKNFYAGFLCFCQKFLREFNIIRVQNRSSDFISLRLEEGVSHSSADNQRVYLLKQVLDNRNLVADFCAAHDCHERTSRVFERISEEFYFFFNQKARNARKIIRDSRCGRMCTVSRSESVVYKNISERCQFLRKIRTVLGFFFTESDIFKKHNFAVFERVCRLFHLFINHEVRCRENNFFAEKLGQSFRNRCKRKFFLRLAFRSSEVGHQYYPRSVLS